MSRKNKILIIRLWRQADEFFQGIRIIFVAIYGSVLDWLKLQFAFLGLRFFPATLFEMKLFSDFAVEELKEIYKFAEEEIHHSVIVKDRILHRIFEKTNCQRPKPTFGEYKWIWQKTSAESHLRLRSLTALSNHAATIEEVKLVYALAKRTEGGHLIESKFKELLQQNNVNTERIRAHTYQG